MYIIIFSDSATTTQLFSRLLASSGYEIDIVEEQDQHDDSIQRPLLVIYDRIYEPALALCDYLAAIDQTIKLLVIVPGLNDDQVRMLYAAGAYSVVTGPLRSSDSIGAIQGERHNWWQPQDAPFVPSV